MRLAGGRFHVHRTSFIARVAGIGPATHGFGDRRSTGELHPYAWYLIEAARLGQSTSPGRPSRWHVVFKMTEITCYCRRVRAEGMLFPVPAL